MDKSNNLLLVVPYLSRMGGVANYYVNIRNFFTVNPYFFQVGSVFENSNILKNIISFFRLASNFNTILNDKEFHFVLLNPSLDLKSIFRDGILHSLAKRKSKNTIIFFHGWHKSTEILIDILLKKLFAYFFFGSDSIVVLSNSFKTKLISWGYRKNIHIETTLASDSAFNNVNEDYIINKYLLTRKIKILFLSRIEKSKGIYEVIDTFALLNKTFNNIELDIAGNGSEYEKVKKYIFINKISNINLHGYVTGKQKELLFQQSHIFFFPTMYGEGFPICIVEAMVYGLPIITRSVGGITDFFENGKMGFISESKNPNYFYELVKKLLESNDLMKTIAVYNSNYAKKAFHPSVVAKRIEKLLQYPNL